MVLVGSGVAASQEGDPDSVDVAADDDPAPVGDGGADAGDTENAPIGRPSIDDIAAAHANTKYNLDAESTECTARAVYESAATDEAIVAWMAQANSDPDTSLAIVYASLDGDGEPDHESLSDAVTACNLGTASSSDAARSTTTARQTTTTEPTTTTEALPIIESGTYLVGDEIEPGVYRYQGYMETNDGVGGINENGNARSGLGIIVVRDSDVLVELNGFAILESETRAIDPIAEGFTDGVYLVGKDIKPGQYRVTNNSRSAYAARLDANLDILDNELNDGSVIITVQASDFALEITGTLELIEG